MQQLFAGQMQVMSRLADLEQERMTRERLSRGAQSWDAGAAGTQAVANNVNPGQGLMAVTGSASIAGAQGQDALRASPGSLDVQSSEVPAPLVMRSKRAVFKGASSSRQPAENLLQQPGPPMQGLVEIQGQKYHWVVKPEGLQLVPVVGPHPSSSPESVPREPARSVLPQGLDRRLRKYERKDSVNNSLSELLAQTDLDQGRPSHQSANRGLLLDLQCGRVARQPLRQDEYQRRYLSSCLQRLHWHLYLGVLQGFRVYRVRGMLGI